MSHITRCRQLQTLLGVRKMMRECCVAGLMCHKDWETEGPCGYSLFLLISCSPFCLWYSSVSVHCPVIHELDTCSKLLATVFTACALALDGKPISTFGSHIINAAKLGPSIFPIVFAAIVGRLMRSAALWRGERGTNLGVSLKSPLDIARIRFV